MFVKERVKKRKKNREGGREEKRKGGRKLKINWAHEKTIKTRFVVNWNFCQSFQRNLHKGEWEE